MNNQPSLADIEAEHGFTFGLPADYDTTAAPVVGTVVCNRPGCERQGQQHTLHADTPQPVLCGACHAVLACDHKRLPEQPEIHYGGTLAAPIRHEIIACLACHTVLNHTPVRVRPEDVPLEAFTPGR